MQFTDSQKYLSGRSRRKLSLRCGVSALLLATVLPVSAQAIEADALPSVGVVVGGSAALDYSVPAELHVRQSSERAVINWDRFDIGGNALAKFYQPSSSSLTVNRVTGSGDPSQILGRLEANGNVMVLDRNGVFFGYDARIDVGALIVSTGHIGTESVLSDDNLTLEGIGTDGIIVNNGSISVADTGLAAFVAPTIVNTGIITAKLGTIDIGAGSKATIDLYGDGLVELELDEGVQQTLANSGILHAQGGTIRMQAAAARNIVDNLISNTGIIAADSIGTDKSGNIVLYAGGASKTAALGGSITVNDGYISANGRASGEKGGSVEVLGDAVLLGSNSLIDVSGDAGGGDIKIGGDYLGTGNTPTSIYTYVDENAVILNDAITNGDGGRTIIWSDHTTDFHGSIYGRGGAQSGDGGFVETSGKINLLADGYVDLTAPNGNKGTYLLDPNDITIYGNFDPNDISSGVMWLDASQLNGYNNNDIVNTWTDSFGLNDVTAFGSGPTYITNSINGLAALRFNNTGMRTTNNLSFNDWSIFMVFRDAASTTSYERLLDHDYVNGFWFGRNDASANSFGGGVKESSNPYGRFITVADGQWNMIGNQRAGTTHTVWTEGDFLGGVTGAVNGTATSSNRVGIGMWHNNGTPGQQAVNIDFAEIIMYGDDLTPAQRNLIEQYQSAKWNIALDPLAGAGTEAAEAMDATSGYGVFTTRYLERLSNTADIVLQATNTITLDLKGDVLHLADDRSIALTTTGGDIRTASTGGIATNRTGSGGNITFTSGDDIAFNHAFTFDAQGGGTIALNAAGDVSAVGGLTVTNGDLAIDAQMITGTYTGKNAAFDSNAGQIIATTTFDSLDIDGSGATLSAGYIGASGPVTQTMANLITIAGNPGTGNSNYKFAGFNIGYISPPPATNTNASLLSKIVSVIQQTAGISANTSKPAGEVSIEDAQATVNGTSPTIASADCLVSLTGFGCVVK